MLRVNIISPDRILTIRLAQGSRHPRSFGKFQANKTGSTLDSDHLGEVVFTRKSN